VPYYRPGSSKAAVHHLRGNLNTQALVHRLGLQHHGLAKRAHRRLAGNPIERSARQRADGVETNIAPQLEPDVPTDVVANGRIKPSPRERLTQRHHPLRPRPIRLTNRKAIEFLVNHHPGLNHLASRIDDTPDGSLRPNRMPLAPANIHSLQVSSFKRPARFVEVPPEDSVHRRHHRRRLPNSDANK